MQAMGAASQRELRTNLALQDIIAKHEQVSSDLESARRDTLTGLPGRALFLELAEGLRETVARRGKGKLAILFVDLDGFKAVNDSLGHEQGDRVLVQAAEILRAQTRDTDAVGRLGGDEFVVCISADADQMAASAQRVANRIVLGVGEIGFGIGCSIGVAQISDACPDISCAMRRADEAMYEAKRRGKNRYVIFDAVPNEDASPCDNSLPSACKHC
jgi:diguanylate cyclase (GGDEF)-like protein